MRKDMTQAEHDALVEELLTIDLGLNLPAKNNVQKYLNQGFGVLCGISNRSINHARATPADLLEVVVDCDDDGYMDADGEIWRYVYCIGAIRPNEQVAS